MSKMGNFTVNFTHFRHFWAILPILVGKRITDFNGFKKTQVKFTKIFICEVSVGQKKFFAKRTTLV
jgi:hypothetical protein